MRPLERLSEVGARPEESRDDRLRAGALILATVGIALISSVWVFTYILFDEAVAAAIPAVYQLVTAVGLVALARTKRFDRYRTTEMACFLVLPALLQIVLGGFVASSGIVLWCVMTPLTALAMLGVRRSIPWLVGFFVVLLVLALLDPALARDPARLPSGLRTAFFVLNLAGLMLGSFLMLGYFVHQRELAHAALEAERERSERLLLNVLPAPIADRLKRHQGVIAEQQDDVTVLFADLVGSPSCRRAWTRPRSSACSTRSSRCSTHWPTRSDWRRSRRSGTRTCSPEVCPRRVEITPRPWPAMRDEVAAIAARAGLGSLSIRIGIDSGPAVAGVIGRRKFIYDLWGDTVNTANRMESHGLPGEVQVTERTATRLAVAFRFEPRGTIDVKGKGSMSTFLLVGERA